MRRSCVPGCEELYKRGLVRLKDDLVEVGGNEIQYARGGGHCGEKEGR